MPRWNWVLSRLNGGQFDLVYVAALRRVKVEAAPFFLAKGKELDLRMQSVEHLRKCLIGYIACSLMVKQVF